MQITWIRHFLSGLCDKIFSIVDDAFFPLLGFFLVMQDLGRDLDAYNDTCLIPSLFTQFDVVDAFGAVFDMCKGVSHMFSATCIYGLCGWVRHRF